MTLRKQVGSLMPALHIAVWVAATYLLLTIAIPGNDLLELVLGTATAACAGAAVLQIGTQIIVGCACPHDQSHSRSWRPPARLPLNLPSM